MKLGKKKGVSLQVVQVMIRKDYFVAPTVIADLDPKARIMQEEIFGPVVGLTKAKSFDEAIEIANNTDYGLTGAVITNNR